MKQILTSLLLVLFFLSGCTESKDFPTPEPNKPQTVETKQVTLVYAVNRNNLSSALDLNMRQMLEALKDMPEGENVILVFKTFNKETDNGKIEMAGLFKAVSGPNAEFLIQKEYSRDVLS
ncbi:MAG: hypothetical protein K2G23_00030, partial [Muribaculaceae bacterium]|nr:hypothetical protein [Muribaculaceae bacterium]